GSRLSRVRAARAGSAWGAGWMVLRMVVLLSVVPGASPSRHASSLAHARHAAHAFSWSSLTLTCQFALALWPCSLPRVSSVRRLGRASVEQQSEDQGSVGESGRGVEFVAG